MNPSPVLRLRGTVHTALIRHVDSQEAAPAERDPETGQVTKQARQARDAYDVYDVSVLTADGGFATVLLRADHLQDAYGGTMPDRSTEIDWPIRCYITWAGREGNRFRVVGYSVAGDLLASEVAAGGSRRRVEPVAS